MVAVRAGPCLLAHNTRTWDPHQYDQLKWNFDTHGAESYTLSHTERGRGVVPVTARRSTGVTRHTTAPLNFAGSSDDADW